MAAVAAVAIAVAAIAITAVILVESHGIAHQQGSRVLIPQNSYYKLPGGQFNAVAFIAKDSSTVSGTFSNTAGINVYMMTPAEVFSLSESGLATGYLWSSGRIANLTVTNLSVSITAGSWDLVFLNTDNPTLNPIYTNITIVGFYTDITLYPD